MNNVILMGRLTRDPKVSDTYKTVVASFNLAVDRMRRKDRESNKQEADFPRIVAFGKTAEFCQKFLKQGMRICVKGHVQTDSYKKDSQTVYYTDIIADQIEFAEPKRKDSTEAAPEEMPFK